MLALLYARLWSSGEALALHKRYNVNKNFKSTSNT